MTAADGDAANRCSPQPLGDRLRRAALVRTALDQLPALDRDVVLLTYWGGHSQSAIAIRTGLDRQTVGRRLFHGLCQLESQVGRQLRADMHVGDGPAAGQRRPTPTPVAIPVRRQEAGYGPRPSGPARFAAGGRRQDDRVTTGTVGGGPSPVPATTGEGAAGVAEEHSARALLREAVQDSHRHGNDLLDNGTPPLAAVGWLAQQGEAFERVIVPQVARLSADGRAQIKQFRRRTRTVTVRLREMERLHSGDATAASLDSEQLAAGLRPLLARQHSDELALIDQLPDDLEKAAGRDLAADYETALTTSPTRPHPHAPHSRLLAGPTYRFHRFRDRLRDTMDNRTASQPTPPASSNPAGQGPDGSGPTPDGADRGGVRQVRTYLILMATCLVLIILAWTVIRLISVPAAIGMSVVAAVLPPIAAIVGNAPRG